MTNNKPHWLHIDGRCPLCLGQLSTAGCVTPGCDENVLEPRVYVYPATVISTHQADPVPVSNSSGTIDLSRVAGSALLPTVVTKIS